MTLFFVFLLLYELFHILIIWYRQKRWWIQDFGLGRLPMSRVNCEILYPFL